MFESRGRQLSLPWTSSSEDSLARTSLRQVSAEVSQESEAGSGTNTAASSTSLGPSGSSSRTWRAGRDAGCPTCGTTCELSVTVRPPSSYLPPTSARPTGASASSSWPTATAGDAKSSGSRCKGEGTTGNPGTSLTDAIVRFPTPNARDWKGPPGAGTIARGGRQSSPPAYVAGWATPLARDGKGPSYTTGCLPRQVEQWPTPTAPTYGSSNNGDPGDGRGSYATAGKASLETTARREGPGLTLNPDWVEALMGAPSGWTAGLVVPEKPRRTGSRPARSRSSRASRAGSAQGPTETAG